MKEEIIANIDNPEQLERLYRADKPLFKRHFKALYPELQNNLLAAFWHTRLSFSREELSPRNNKDLYFVIVASLIAGLVAKLPDILRIGEEYFYSRHIGFIIFPFLAAFFALKNNLTAGKIAIIAATTLGAVLYMNLLPDNPKSDTLVLSCIHLNLILWGMLGFAYTGGSTVNNDRRLGYLRYNGDLVVITTLILIAGGILTGITIGLFSLIGFQIEKFYFDYIVIFALPAAPILGTYLIHTNPQLVGRVSPVIARIFSPLVFVMLVIYLIAMIYSGKDPYNDREFLMIFNALLIGVMAIIFFSVAGSSGTKKNVMEVWILFSLSIVTDIVTGVAISAIVFRIAEWGITPNRAAVLGSNILILVNLLLVTAGLLKVIIKKSDVSVAGRTITQYLPIYLVWAAIVTFFFPLIFGFK